MKISKTLVFVPLLCAIVMLLSACQGETVAPRQDQPDLAAASGHLVVLPSNTCGRNKVADLGDGGGNIFGQVEMMNDRTHLYGYFQTKNGWFIHKYRMYGGPRSAIPVNNAGTKLNVEKFPYTGSFLQPVSEELVSIPMPSTTCNSFLLYVQVVRLDFFGNIVLAKDAWLLGNRMHQGFVEEFCTNPC